MNRVLVAVNSDDLPALRCQPRVERIGNGLEKIDAAEIGMLRSQKDVRLTLGQRAGNLQRRCSARDKPVRAELAYSRGRRLGVVPVDRERRRVDDLDLEVVG